MAHTCHATECDTPVPPQMWGCRRHWFMIPAAIRGRIWRSYRSGQCDDMKPSQEYLEAARNAVIAVALKEGKEPATRLYDSFLAGYDMAALIDGLNEIVERGSAECKACGFPVEGTLTEILQQLGEHGELVHPAEESQALNCL